ncbi:MAG: hypothetical protein RSD67_06425 [Oscillospiraceae bacterium]
MDISKKENDIKIKKSPAQRTTLENSTLSHVKIGDLDDFIFSDENIKSCSEK